MKQYSRKFNSRKFTRHDNPIQSKQRPFTVNCLTNNGPLLNRLGHSLYEEPFETSAVSKGERVLQQRYEHVLSNSRYPGIR